MVPAVDRACQILELVASSSQGLKVSQVAAALSLPRSGTYALVNTLSAHGMLTIAPGGTLAIGPALFSLGSAYGQSLDLTREATDVAGRLMRECDETVQVAVLEGRHVVYIAKADSRQALRLVSTVGRRIPAHVAAIGKIQLALLPPDELDGRLEGVELESFTPRSVTSHDLLRRELELIQTRGYALDESESNPDICCIAAPVWDVHGHNVAGISVSVPVTRFDVAGRDALRVAVLRGAAELSRRLGHLPRSQLDGDRVAADAGTS
jgi:IclR family KDG regulon transcriptional repressor